MSAEEKTVNAKIKLVIENKSVTCSKEELSKSSDYFKAMFNGSFTESQKKTIKLKDVKHLAFTTLLKLLKDPKSDIKDEELYIDILETSMMLQFETIKQLLLTTRKIKITIQNSLQLWQGMKRIGLNSLEMEYNKYCLVHFEEVKFTEYIHSLSVPQLYNYLADKRLNAWSEYNVYEVGQHWWNTYSKNKTVSPVFREKAFLCFLFCLDFQKLSIEDIHRMLPYMEKSNCDKSITILKAVIEVKKGSYRNNESTDVHTTVTKLLKSEPRNSKLFCMMLKEFTGPEKRKSSRASELERDSDLMYYHGSKKKFLNFCHMKWSGLVGFKMISYLEKIYVLGGEFGLGTGSWNTELWVYDCFTETWTECAWTMFVRRHFLAVVGGPYIYLIGGVGSYRKVLHNMVWYDADRDVWSSPITLPSNDIYKGGFCNGYLLLMNSNLQNAYAYDHDTGNWSVLSIKLPKSIPSPLSGKYEIVTYQNIIYIRGEYFIKMSANKDYIIEVNDVKKMDTSKTDILSMVCVSHTEIYSVCKPLLQGRNDFTLEHYCTETHTSKVLLHFKKAFKASYQYNDTWGVVFALHNVFCNENRFVNEFTF